MEHKKCKGCKWNIYPLCKGIIMDNGNFMNIENLKNGFKCGQKDALIEDNLIPKSTINSRLLNLEEKISELEKGGE